MFIRYIPTIYLSLSALFWVCVYFLGWDEVWQGIFVRTFHDDFSDLRVTQAAVIGSAEGRDPTVDNYVGNNDSLYNHPPLALNIARFFRFDLEWAFLTFCYVSIALYTFTIWTWLRRFPSWLLLVASLSGAVMLPMERLNNDIHVFLLLVLGLYLGRGYQRAILFAFVSALKIFPLFAFSALLPLRKEIGKWRISEVAPFLLASIFFIGYFLVFMDEILHGISVTEKGAASAYGVWVNSFLVEERFFAFPFGDQLQWAFYAIFSVAVIVFRARLAALLKFSGMAGKTNSELMLVAFWVGAPIYSISYVLMANWDYRMLFCILTIPFMLTLGNRIYVAIFSVTLIVALNYYAFVGLFDDLGGGINIAAKWLAHLMIYLVLLLCALSLIDRRMEPVKS